MTGNNKRTAALHNLGCKVNAYELEAMQEKLEDAGYEIRPFAPGADVYIINTCTVTNIADKKSRQMLHKAKKMNPDALVVAVGCYVDTNAELKTDSAIDIVVKNSEKKDIVAILGRSMGEKENTPGFGSILNAEGADARLELTRRTDHTRAYIKVQDGCNQFCSYCIIPFARGRVKSRPKRDVIEEVQNLAKVGYKEVVLTGIHLSSYGIDMTDGDISLIDLIHEVQNVEGIKRIRLGSLEPRIITEEFARRLSSMEKVCPHFHLSLQSGSDTTLRRMNRRYSAAEYRKGCEILRKYFDNPALTTDVIVGFPGESETEFSESMAFIDSIRFYETHIFKYSRRKGTKADRMEGQIPEVIKQERSASLIALGEKHKAAYIRQHLHRRLDVLIEEQAEIEGSIYDIGYTREYIKVCIPSNGHNRKNCMVEAEAIQVDEAGYLLGKE